MNYCTWINFYSLWPNFVINQKKTLLQDDKFLPQSLFGKNLNKYEMHLFPTGKFHKIIDLILTKFDFTIYIQKLKQIII